SRPSCRHSSGERISWASDSTPGEIVLMFCPPGRPPQEPRGACRPKAQGTSCQASLASVGWSGAPSPPVRPAGRPAAGQLAEPAPGGPGPGAPRAAGSRFMECAFTQVTIQDGGLLQTRFNDVCLRGVRLNAIELTES